eukprot:TRINITY_DN890_c0_g1_i1.p2 TRINITY_DN890_c0_g1~~TRINITY_DN890_c0_g1_i1.p2  ORF type:complete len:286 (-),score=65.21 TRINITY_DN890_c0_g1_i1:334-1191(-)
MSAMSNRSRRSVCTVRCADKVFLLGLEQLGRGNISKVLSAVATDIRDRQQYAIKVIEKAKSKHPRWINELRILGHLRGHKNIVQLHGSCESEAQVFMVFRKLQRNLLEVLNQQPGSLAQETPAIMSQLVDALVFAKSKGISHLDIKLENIMLAADRTPVLIDFGFAEQVKPGQRVSHGRGSFHYVCPEIAADTPFDPEKADVWSLGVVMFTMLTDRLPFDPVVGSNDPAVIFATIIRGQYRLPPSIDPLAADLIAKMLDVNEATRLDLAAVSRHPYLMPAPVPCG